MALGYRASYLRRSSCTGCPVLKNADRARTYFYSGYLIIDCDATLIVHEFHVDYLPMLCYSLPSFHSITFSRFC